MVGYAGLGVQRAFAVSEAGVSGQVFAFSIVMVLAISLGLVAREVLFGFRTQSMSRAFDEANLPADFEDAKAAAEQRPEDWQAWYAVALKYDEAKDRRRARAAMRQAERLFTRR